ncbi:MAG TPA: type II toxin-antitoxin system VapC family toxin [Nitrospirales bacterium]
MDTNLLVYLLVPSGLTSQSEAVFEQDSQWVTPLLWRSEFRSALVGLIRQGHITLEIARQIAHQAESWMSGREYSVSTDRVLGLASASVCSSYDCEFVAVAKDLSVPLVTADKQILRAFPETAVSLDAFLA